MSQTIDPSSIQVSSEMERREAFDKDMKQSLHISVQPYLELIKNAVDAKFDYGVKRFLETKTVDFSHEGGICVNTQLRNTTGEWEQDNNEIRTKLSSFEFNCEIPSIDMTIYDYIEKNGTPAMVRMLQNTNIQCLLPKSFSHKDVSDDQLKTIQDINFDEMKEEKAWKEKQKLYKEQKERIIREETEIENTRKRKRARDVGLGLTESPTKKQKTEEEQKII